jgi:hypothetical protein
MAAVLIGPHHQNNNNNTGKVLDWLFWKKYTYQESNIAF